MSFQKKDYFSYLLRLWLTGNQTNWRASLENPHTGQKLTFSNLEQLFSFLKDQCWNQEDQERDIH